MSIPKNKIRPKQEALVIYNQTSWRQFTQKDVRQFQSHNSNRLERFTRIFNLHESAHDNQGIFDIWCNNLIQIDINLDGFFDPNIKLFEHLSDKFDYRWVSVVSEFMQAIKEHKELQATNIHAAKISNESAKQFLFLVPILAEFHPRVYIDSANGCLNIDVSTRDKGLLSAQISGTGQIYYSLVSKNNKIYKITGVAKFKDKKDFIKFSKVLQMT
jgi:hypothetical protein